MKANTKKTAVKGKAKQAEKKAARFPAVSVLNRDIKAAEEYTVKHGETIMQKWFKVGEDINTAQTQFTEYGNKGSFWGWFGNSREDGAVRMSAKMGKKALQLYKEWARVQKQTLLGNAPTSLNEAGVVIAADKRETGEAPKGSGTKAKTPEQKASELIGKLHDALEAMDTIPQGVQKQMVNLGKMYEAKLAKAAPKKAA